MPDEFKEYKLLILKELDRNTEQHIAIDLKIDAIDIKLAEILTKLNGRDNRFKVYVALITVSASVGSALITALMVS